MYISDTVDIKGSRSTAVSTGRYTYLQYERNSIRIPPRRRDRVRGWGIVVLFIRIIFQDYKPSFTVEQKSPLISRFNLQRPHTAIEMSGDLSAGVHR